MSRLLVVSLALAALVFSGCGPPRFRPPAGPGAAAPDAQAIWAAASAPCRDLRSYQASLQLEGRIDRRRVPGLAGATLNVAIAPDLSLGLEARAAGQLIFRLGGTPARSTLVWRDGNRVATAPARDLIEALVGVPMDAARLRTVLAGCVTTAESIANGVRFERVIRVTAEDATVFVSEQQGRWRPAAGTFEGFTVTYDQWRADLPRRMHLDSDPGREPEVALTLTVIDVVSNPTLPPAAFAVSVPDGATSMTLDELRNWRRR